MNDIQKENAELVSEIEEQEAGVKDLYEFYINIESVYSSSIKALIEEDTSYLTNNTNGCV